MSGIICRPMRRVYGGVRNMFEHAYNEMSLGFRTRLRETKVYLNVSIPVIACKNRNRVSKSYKRIREHIGLERALAKQRDGSNAADLREGNTPRRDILRDAADETSYRATFRLLDEERATGQHRIEISSRTRLIPWRRYNQPKVARSRQQNDRNKYIESTRRLRRNIKLTRNSPVQTQTTSSGVLEQTQNQEGVGLPSDRSDSHEDPVLPQHQLEARVEDIFNRFGNFVSIRCQEEVEKRRRIAEAEAQWQQMVATFNTQSASYTQRVQALLSIGPNLESIVNELERCFVAGRVEGFMQAAIVLVNDLLQPAYTILMEMKDEIMLENVGAQQIAAAWPLERLHSMLECLEHHGNELPGFIHRYVRYMMDSIKIICTPIINATPFVNPLDSISLEVPAELQPEAIDFASFMAAMQTQQSLAEREQQFRLDLPYQGVPLAPAKESLQSHTIQEPTKSTENNFSSFSAAIAAVRAQSEAREQQSTCSIFGRGDTNAGTVDNLNQELPDAPAIVVTDHDTDQDANARAEKRIALMALIDSFVLDFDEEVSRIYEKRALRTHSRTAIIRDLKKVVAAMDRDTDILGSMDASTFSLSLRELIRKINSMPAGKQKNHELTLEMLALARRCLTLWPAGAFTED